MLLGLMMRVILLLKASSLYRNAFALTIPNQNAALGWQNEWWQFKVGVLNQMTFRCTWRSSVLSTWTESDDKAASVGWKILQSCGSNKRWTLDVWEGGKREMAGNCKLRGKNKHLHGYYEGLHVWSTIYMSGECKELCFRPVSVFFYM